MAWGASRSMFPPSRVISARSVFHGDAITLVQGVSLKGFDGALCRAPAGRSGWGIIYNDAPASKGRISFTLGHEFGHYLLHRVAYPDGIECGQQDMVRWDEGYKEIEQQANCFAAGLLMPLNDYRKQIPEKARPTLEDRYGLSLIAATLRWLEYAERRSVLVVSRDGYILWARSSKSALKRVHTIAPLTAPRLQYLRRRSPQPLGSAAAS